MRNLARHTFPTVRSNNASQYLCFGFEGWPANASLSSKDIAEHLKRVYTIPAPDIYRKAYERWKRLLTTAGVSMEPLSADIRLFIGMSDPSIFETNITLHLPYGVPYIPGSACKGLARRAGIACNGAMPPNGVQCLFGDTDDSGQGYVYFHDAWWVPGSAPGANGNAPLVREVVTPHHKEFMDTKGEKPATPFDSPTPIPQIAAHGTFLFAVEGSTPWAQLGLYLLKLGLQHEGIGARTPEYGTFSGNVATSAGATLKAES